MPRRVLVPLELSPAVSLRGGAGMVETIQGETMGTSWSVKLVCPGRLSPVELRNGIQKRLDRVVAQMSNWERGSHISRFNQADAGSWHTVPEEFFTVLHYALSLAELSDGAYDPTIGPLTDLWGFGPTHRRLAPPSADQIAEARSRCSWRRVPLARETRRVQQLGGIGLDFSSIAKGFGVDEVAKYITQQGIEDYLVEVGGELRGEGGKPDGQPWWVALESPNAEAGSSGESGGTLLALHGLAVATSGDYRRFFQSAGRRYSHTLDPRTGCPITNGVASVTVLHRSCMQADALATGMTVLGSDAGMAFALQHHVAALFVCRDGDCLRERMSPAFAAMLN